jgi:hypothetical protein
MLEYCNVPRQKFIPGNVQMCGIMHMRAKNLHVDVLHCVRSIGAALIVSLNSGHDSSAHSAENTYFAWGHRCVISIFPFRSLHFTKIRCRISCIRNLKYDNYVKLRRRRQGRATSMLLIWSLTDNSQRGVEEATRGSRCPNQPWQTERNWLLSNGKNPVTWKERCASESKTWIETFVKEDEAMTANENGSIGISKVNLVRTFL